MGKITEITITRGVSYRKWLSEVDALIMESIGLSALDMEDYLWRDDFEDGLNPFEAAESAFDYWSSDFLFERISGEAFEKLRKFQEEDSEIPGSRDLVNFRVRTISRESGSWAYEISQDFGREILAAVYIVFADKEPENGNYKLSEWREGSGKIDSGISGFTKEAAEERSRELIGEYIREYSPFFPEEPKAAEGGSNE